MAGEAGLRTHLCVGGLVKVVRGAMEAIDRPRAAQSRYTLADAAMAVFAMFSLKDCSLLAFEERRNDANLMSLYGLVNVPSDTQMRAILDPLPPECLRPAFRDVFRQLQRGKVLERYVVLDGCYLLAMDGTQYFRSEAIHCASCLVAEHRDGRVTYRHQMLGAALVHPDHREVIPLCPEPIINQDGKAKNDCERNAAKRFCAKFRQEHPHLPVIVVEDGLSSNAPHIVDLAQHNMHYILVAKEGDHAVLFAEFQRRLEAGEADFREMQDLANLKVRHQFTVVRQVALNASHPDILVNVLDYKQITRDPITGEESVLPFTWVTDLELTGERVYSVMRAGRARWKIENETFNTLKNQGYHFEHNYGHGYQHLSVVFALIMMLAFLVDQAAQICDPLFQAALQRLKSRRALWDKLRALFESFQVAAWEDLYQALAYGFQRPDLQPDTS